MPWCGVCVPSWNWVQVVCQSIGDACGALLRHEFSCMYKQGQFLSRSEHHVLLATPERRSSSSHGTVVKAYSSTLLGSKVHSFYFRHVLAGLL